MSAVRTIHLCKHNPFNYHLKHTYSSSKWRVLVTSCLPHQPSALCARPIHRHASIFSSHQPPPVCPMAGKVSTTSSSLTHISLTTHSNSPRIHAIEPDSLHSAMTF